MKKSQNIANIITRWRTGLLPLAVLILLLTAWEIGVRITNIQKWILPAPSLIFKSLWQAKELIWQHSSQTLFETSIGLTIAIIVGVIIATLTERFAWIRAAVYPLLVITQTIPIIVVAPLLILWLGYGVLPKIMVVALVCFFPVAVNLADGYRSVDGEMVRLLSSMGASQGQIFRLVKLPAALPSLFSGLRIAGTYSVMGAVIGEMLGASKGLGIFITLSSKSYLTERVFAAILVISALSLIIMLLVEGMARLCMPWYYQQIKQ